MRMAFMLVWTLSIPALGVFAARSWLRDPRFQLSLWRKALGVMSIVQLVISWLSFVALSILGQIGGFGSHFTTTRLADLFLLISLSAAFTGIALKKSPRLATMSAGVLVTALWFGSEVVA